MPDTPKKATRPPVGITPSIPIDIQRALRNIAQFAFDAQDKADSAHTALAGKVSKTEPDLLEVSQFVSRQVQAGGKYPLSLTGLPGRASLNQFAYIPTVPMLPLRSNSLAATGQAVIYKGQLYVYNTLIGSTGANPVNPGAGSSPGQFVPVIAQPSYTQVTQSGLAALVATLGATNAGLLIWVTDYNHVLEWTGSGLVWGPGESGSGYFQGFAVAPTGNGWHACDGSFVNYLRSDGTLGGAVLPNTVSSAAYMKYGSAYNSTIQVADVPLFTGYSAPLQLVSTYAASEFTVQAPYAPSGTIGLPGDPVPNFTALLYFRM